MRVGVHYSLSYHAMKALRRVSKASKTNLLSLYGGG